MGTTLVFLEVIDADGNLRTLWEDETRCLTSAHQMYEGKMTYDGRPTHVKALVCMYYPQDNANPHMHRPEREAVRWSFMPWRMRYDGVRPGPLSGCLDE